LTVPAFGAEGILPEEVPFELQKRGATRWCSMTSRRPLTP
jgi:hypothetical protein